jgi:hypothetical protein
MKRSSNLESVAEAKRIVDEFLAAVDADDVTATTPREVAMVRRLQGASVALGAVLEGSQTNHL